MKTLLVLIIGLGLSTSALAQDLAGDWQLSIADTHHKMVATLTIEFTNKDAQSCMGGDWKQVKVVSSNALRKGGFPVADPLSYTVQDKQLTIGRVEICDAYLLLKGALKNDAMTGDYYTLGLGGTSSLGSFTLNRTK